MCVDVNCNKVVHVIGAMFHIYIYIHTGRSLPIIESPIFMVSKQRRSMKEGHNTEVKISSVLPGLV